MSADVQLAIGDTSLDTSDHRWKLLVLGVQQSSGIVVALPFDLARVSFVGHIRLRFNTRLRSKICSESDVAMSAEGANARRCARRGADATHTYPRSEVNTD